MIDLHCHSTASDGTFSPADLIREAQRLELSAIALTDHDTVAGLGEFLEAARTATPTAVPGVEIACRWYGGSLHMVGLFIDPACPELLAVLEGIRDGRLQRNPRIIARLNELGMPLDMREVEAAAGGDVVGRPHIAAVMVRRGFCATPKEAFTRFLGHGRPAYAPRVLPSPTEGIAAIHAAAGLAIWAHPLGLGNRSTSSMRSVAKRLVEHELDGVETRYSDYTAAQRRDAARVADELGLLHAGGSDFHGAHTPELSLGSGRGDLHVPDAFLPPLAAAARRRKLASNQA